MNQSHLPVRKLIWVTLFAIAFAFVESSVVVYLRALYYPDGFALPLRAISNQHLVVELLREAATIVMLVAIGVVAGSSGWQRFGYFCLAFGVWDIFYYVWLKTLLDWPATIIDWDILFLIPAPWIGPVLSPVLVAVLMSLFGIDIVKRIALERYFRPRLISWVCASIATGVILYSYMHDTDATLKGTDPLPYHYELLALGMALYLAGYVFACRVPSGARKIS